MKTIFYFVLISLTPGFFYAQTTQERSPNPAPLKPRIVVLTDISTWEPDDHESLIRLLVHADMLEIEEL